MAMLVVAGLSGCAVVEQTAVPPAAPESGVANFSSAPAGGEWPGGWRAWTLSRFKKPTHYRLVKDDGRTVVRAESDAYASGLVHSARVDPRQFPLLKWRWKVNKLIAGADNARRDTEDAPVRIIIAFDGDHSRLSFEDRIFFSQVRMMTGQQMPYTTLMYIWENRAPVGTVIPSRHTSRVRMIVADSGASHLGTWRQQSRNVYEDYRRAFGEDAPMIKSVAIMTDTDNTGTQVAAYYGDIAFARATVAQQLLREAERQLD